MKRKIKKILIILGAGGHTEQMIKLVQNLGDNFTFVYVVADDDKVSKARMKNHGIVYSILNPRKMIDKNLLVCFFKFIYSFFQSVKIILKTNPDCILGCGPGLIIPLIISGKMFGKKVIFLESWSRVYTKSLSGKIAYLFSNLFFVQWPELKKKYPKSIYAGRLS